MKLGTGAQKRRINPATAQRIVNNTRRAEVVLESMTDYVRRRFERPDAHVFLTNEDVWARIARTRDILEKMGWPERYIAEEIEDRLPGALRVDGDLNGHFHITSRGKPMPWTEEELTRADASFWKHAEKMARIWAARNGHEG